MRGIVLPQTNHRIYTNDLVCNSIQSHVYCAQIYTYTTILNWSYGISTSVALQISWQLAERCDAICKLFKFWLVCYDSDKFEASREPLLHVSLNMPGSEIARNCDGSVRMAAEQMPLFQYSTLNIFILKKNQYYIRVVLLTPNKCYKLQIITYSTLHYNKQPTGPVLTYAPRESHIPFKFCGLFTSCNKSDYFGISFFLFC